MQPTEPTYDEAFAELQNIVAAMESQVIQLDDFALQTERAAYLLRFCQDRLRDTTARFEAHLKAWE